MNIEKDILLKAWELTQSIAKNNAETAWKVRMWGITIWGALLSYAYTNNSHSVIVISFLILFPIFIFECGIRVIEYKMIYFSHEIENSLNTLLVGSDLHLPDEGIKINITETSIVDLKKILTLKRWLIWGPYVCLALVSLASLVIV
ncbi:hypothetical protein C1Y42_17900 [Pantoea sp. ICBG 985]|uniref:hypothetical protein n=1 Tax=Pantoea sp. ICBG 985 TaxID=2071683 RepID=UPI000CE572D6|nr:hypothetical protein [Pantoea sp. ICBG 985]PPC68818.1 hypothetical protein C1Y42_17900 [Pantoea sp. ICBG 985]